MRKSQVKPLEPLSNDKIEELKEYIAKAPEAGNFTKQVLFWLIDQSNKLAKPVSVLFTEKNYNIGEKVSSEVHDMLSRNRDTKLDDYLEKLGTQMRIRSYFNSTEGGYMIVFSPEHYLKYFMSLENCMLDMEAIQEVVLPN